MKKKIVAVLISAVMVFSLAACGSNGDDTTNPTPTPTQSAGSPTEEANDVDNAESTPEATPTEALPSYDFGGRVVRIGSYYDMAPNPESSAFQEAFADRIKFVEDNYNCTIEFVNLGGNYVDQYVTSVLAGDPVVDVGYMLSYRLLPSMIEGGIAYPISELNVFDFSEYKWDQAAIESGVYKGKNYALRVKEARAEYGIFYNKTLFRQLGLTDLNELYQKGEWTWDKLSDYAIAGNQDTDNNGENDIWGFNQRENLIWSFMSSNGANAVKKTADGVALDLESKEAKEALEGYANFMLNVPHLKGWLGDWQSQIYSFRDGQSMMCYEAWWISYGYLKDMADEWGYVPFPSGPSATEYASYGKEADPLMMLNGIDNPEEVAQILNLIYDVYETEEDWDDSVVAIFESQANDAESVEVCLTLSDKIQISPLMGFGDLNTLINDMMNEIGNGSSTPQTALETYKSALDKAIEDIKSHDYDADMQEYSVEEEEAEE